MLSSFDCGGSKWWIKVTSSPTAHFLESSVHQSTPGALAGSPLLLKAKEALPLIGFDTVWPFSSTAFQPTRLPASAVVQLLTDGPAECSDTVSAQHTRRRNFSPLSPAEVAVPASQDSRECKLEC